MIRERVPLAPYTTLGVGGPARFFATVRSEAELLEGVAFARDCDLPLFALGGGSNLLVPDEGYPGVVLHLCLQAPTERHGNCFRAAAGTDWNDLVREVCSQGLSGMECLAGIPGLVGGSPIQNIGAYGQEVASSIETVHAFDRSTMQFVDLPREACGFRYRASIFNTTERNRFIVTAVTFRLVPAARPTLAYADLQRYFAGRPAPSSMEVYHAVREIRRGKGMLVVEGDPDSRSAGSFFKNPLVPVPKLASLARALSVDEAAIPHWATGQENVKVAAAWLVERAGFQKGYASGRAGISSRHTLALVNRGGATFADIASLRDTIRREVHSRFDVLLEQEPIEPGL